MKRIARACLLILISISFAALIGCHPEKQKGEYIVDAEDVSTLLSQANTVLVDTQQSTDYKEKHIDGAVNISRSHIVVNTPYPNMLASSQQIAEILGLRGISNETLVIIYDNNNNMDAARLWWTLLVYGHTKAKVVSGGLEALEAAGFSANADRVATTPATFTISVKNKEYIASTGDVKNQVDDPDPDVCIIDTRTLEEYTDGTIPGSIHINYTSNNFKDGTYRPVRQIRILYREAGIKPEDTAIMYCKSSIRAAQTFLAMYNAGYPNLKIYDAAWLGWSDDSSLPVYRASGEEVQATVQDGS